MIYFDIFHPFLESKIVSIDSQKLKEKEEFELEIKSAEDKLTEKDREEKLNLENVNKLKAEVLEYESQNQRDQIRIQHFEEDEEVMKLKYDELRSEFRLGSAIS